MISQIGYLFSLKHQFAIPIIFCQTPIIKLIIKVHRFFFGLLISNLSLHVSNLDFDFPFLI